jgi:Putative Ig domain
MSVRRARAASVILAIIALAGLATTAVAAPLTILTATLPNGTQWKAYTPIPLVTLNGVPPVTWAVVTGALPPGITLTTTLGVTYVGGTPTLAGSFGFTLSASDAGGQVGSMAYVVIINPPLVVATPSLPDGRIGTAYSQTLTATGGTAPYGWLVTAGSLPAGLSLGPLTGLISGTPTTEGSSTFTVTVTDTALATATGSFTINVTSPPHFTVTGAVTWVVDRAGFSMTVTGSGGTGSLSWGAVTGVPDGLGASRVGDVLTVSGTPTKLGTWNLSVTITDGASEQAVLAQGIRIDEALALHQGAFEEATLGQPWTQAVPVSGGAEPFSFELTGSPPTWLAIDDSSGLLSGTPDAVGTSSIDVRVAGAAGGSDTETYDLTVNAAPQIAGTRLPVAVPNTAYAETLSVTGGTAPFTVSVQSGHLPAGLSFSGLELTGTPTTSGRNEATLTVTDHWGASDTATVTLTVARASAMKNTIPAFDLTAGSQEAWVIDVIANTALSFNLSGKSRLSDLSLRLVYLDGTEVDLTSYQRNEKKKVKLKKVPLPLTGRVILIVTYDGADPITLKGKIKGKASGGFKSTEAWGPASGLREIPFAALAGSRVSIEVKAKGKDVPAADFVSLSGPGGALDVTGLLADKSSGFKIKKLSLTTAGDHVLAFQPAATGAAAGTVTVKVKIDPPGDYVYAHPTGGALLRVDPGAVDLLFRDDFDSGPAADWRLDGVRFVEDTIGARLVLERPGGAAVLSRPTWSVTEIYAELRLSGVVPDGAVLDLRSEDDAPLSIRIETRDGGRIAVLRGDEILAAAMVPIAPETSILLGAQWSDGVVRVQIDGRPVLEIPGLVGARIAGTALRPDAGLGLVLESFTLLGR